MKIEYFGPEPGTNQPRYFLRPESSVECRFLTILRNLALRPNVFIRVTGTEDNDTSKPGLPDRPVMAMSIVLHDNAVPKRAEALGADADPRVGVIPEEPRHRSERVKLM